MKALSLFYATLLAAASVQASPIADAEAWCNRPGQSCGKLKRAADAAAEALAFAEPEPVAEADAAAEAWCSRPGQSCGKAKRAADALADADAVADAYAAANAEPWCNRPGQSCGKVKREAGRRSVPTSNLKVYTNIIDSEPSPEAIAEAEAEAEAWCNRPGQSCGKVKREPGTKVKPTYVSKIMLTCSFSLEPIAEADAEAEAWCNRPGQSCGKAKRAADALADGAAAALASF